MSFGAGLEETHSRSYLPVPPLQQGLPTNYQEEAVQTKLFSVTSLLTNTQEAQFWTRSRHDTVGSLAVSQANCIFQQKLFSFAEKEQKKHKDSTLCISTNCS
jgi:hypothetical protein